MSQTQTESKPPAADVQPAVFVRMAAVVRMTVNGCQEALFSGCEDAVLVFGL